MLRSVGQVGRTLLQGSYLLRNRQSRQAIPGWSWCSRIENGWEGRFRHPWWGIWPARECRKGLWLGGAFLSPFPRRHRLFGGSRRIRGQRLCGRSRSSCRSRCWRYWRSSVTRAWMFSLTSPQRRCKAHTRIIIHPMCHYSCRIVKSWCHFSIVDSTKSL